MTMLLFFHYTSNKYRKQSHIITDRKRIQTVCECPKLLFTQLQKYHFREIKVNQDLTQDTNCIKENFSCVYQGKHLILTSRNILMVLYIYCFLICPNY